MSTTELTRLQAMHGLESRTVTQQQVALQLALSVVKSNASGVDSVWKPRPA